MSTDTKWLSWLKYQFTDVMIKSNRYNNGELHVTLKDFLDNFYFKEKFLAERLFCYMDKDSSGTLSLHEFINGLEVVVNGSQEEKMEFLFKVFDVDGDGYIDNDELRIMLKCCLEDSPSLDTNETIDDLTAILFKRVDVDSSGQISLNELKKGFKEYESIFKTLTINTSVWIKPKFIEQKEKGSLYHKIADLFINQRATVYFWTVYLIINLLCMITAFWNYRTKSPFIICARIFGNSLNFNCSLILVLVLRKHFTWLRMKGASNFIPLDHFIDIHKKIGMIILYETLIHTIAHLIYLYLVCAEENVDGLYWTALFTAQKTPVSSGLGYPTGVIELVLLVIIIFFASSFIRRKGFFQVFYWFHMLTIPWLFIMMLHGPRFWVWLLLPAFCFAIEKILKYRKVRSNKFGDTIISEAIVLPSKVTHLVIRRPPKFRFKPGDYVFINIPTIAKYEWHPFSISSAPEKSDFLWLHIRAVGNWTKKLYTYSLSSNFDIGNSVVQSSMNRLNMRARMSKVLTDNDLFPILNRKENMLTNKLDVDGEEDGKLITKKIVSFVNTQNKSIIIDKNSNQIIIRPENEQEREEKLDTNGEKTTSEACRIENGREPKHKGILKLIMLENSNKTLSFNGNETIANNNNDLPTESTPKFHVNNHSEMEEKDEKKHSPPEQQLEETISDLNKKANLIKGLSKSVDFNTKKELKIVKSATQDQKIDFNNSQTKTPIQQMEKAKQQPYSDGMIVKRRDNRTIIINLDENQNHKYKEESLVIYMKDENDNDENIDKNLKEQLHKLDNRDELGYLKMYSTVNRVSMNTIGEDRLYRLKIFIDGPYGTPNQDIFDAEHAVLIGAGIGITPFASILQSLMIRHRHARAVCPNCDCKLNDQFVFDENKLNVKKVDFVWVTREQRSLEWFISMLSQMEIEQRKNNENFLETHLYVTSAKRQSDLRSINLQLTLDAIFSEEETNMVDGLLQRTHYGRPNWDIVLQNLIRKQKGKITVFYCGPPGLLNALQTKCREYNLSFKKEIF